MAHVKKHTEKFTVMLTPEWAERLVNVADHPKIQDAYAQVIRDCIETALPGFELALGIVEAEPEPQRIEPQGWGPDRPRG
jgi:hypothetical protein